MYNPAVIKKHRDYMQSDAECPLGMPVGVLIGNNCGHIEVR